MFLFFKGSANNAVRITDRVAIHRTLSNIAGLFGVIFHHILKADVPINVANKEIVILIFKRIIPRVTPTSLECLFYLTFEDTSLSRIFSTEIFKNKIVKILNIRLILSG